MEKHGVNVYPPRKAWLASAGCVCATLVFGREGASGVSGAVRPGTSEQTVLKQHNRDSRRQRLLQNVRSIPLISWELFLPWERKLEFSSVISSAPVQALSESPAEQIVTLK